MATTPSSSSSSSSSDGDKNNEDKQDRPPAKPETDTEELKRFREKWKRELQPASSSLSSTTLSSTSHHNEAAYVSSSTSLDTLSTHNIAYPRSLIGENTLITRFLALLDEEEQEEQAKQEDESKGGKKEGEAALPPPVSVLPAELQLSILANLDVKSLEHCSVVCRFWYILARDEGLPQFQALCLLTWAGITTSIFENYQCDWRTMYLHRPRLRDDGIYISRNYYLRAGQTEGSYYQPVHEVVYYRYLRFFSQGTVMYTLSSDAPKQVLNWFKPSAAPSSQSSHRAVHFGTYVLEADVVQVWAKISSTHTTCLDLQVASSRVGRNDRLALMEYKCVHDDDDIEKIDVAIKKFHFVKLPKQYLQDAQVIPEVQ